MSNFMCFPHLTLKKKGVATEEVSEEEKKKEVKPGVATEEEREEEKKHKAKPGVAMMKNITVQRSEKFSEATGDQLQKQPEEVLSESGPCDREKTLLPLDDMEQEVKQSLSLNEGNSEKSLESEKFQLEGKSLEDFNFLSMLGKGAFSKIILAELRGTDEVYALKIMKKDMILKCNMLKYTCTERRILALASKHPYLMHLCCCFQTSHYLCFAMEYMNGGDLFYHIACSGGFDEPCSQFYAAEIACALMFLHHNGIIHRDVKPENVLLDADGHCKLGDFGLSKESIVDGMTTTTVCGSKYYMAPEMIQELEYSVSVDWWALGVTMYVMMMGELPFYDENRKNVYESILHDEIYCSRGLSSKAVSILKAFLEKDPKARLGCVVSEGQEEAIKVHPFFKNISWVLLEQRKITPPFKPLTTAKRDVNNFEKHITCEEPKLSFVNNTINKPCQDEFKDFAYISTKY